jgi:DNA-binding GntR family transcriptional regulator
MQVSEWVSVSLNEHAQMIENLEKGNRAEAVRILNWHWIRSMEGVLTKFREA